MHSPDDDAHDPHTERVGEPPGLLNRALVGEITWRQ